VQLKPFLKVMISLGILLIGLLVGALGTGWFTASAMPDLERLGPTELQVLERELSTELLVLNLQIVHLQADRERVKGKLAELGVSGAKEEHRLTAARARLEETSGRLGSWLRHFYEEGRLPLVGLLLQAENVADFWWRLDLFRVLIGYEYDLLNEIYTLNAVIQERLHRLAELSAEIENAESKILFQLAEQERVQNRKAEFLAQVRVRSVDLAERLAGLEQQWQDSLAPLNNLLKRLDIALARELQPDRVYFQGRNVMVEVSSATINRILRQTAGDTEDNIRVDIDPDGLTVTSVNREGRTDFQIFGRLVPVSGGEKVVFRSGAVLVDGLEIDAAALPFLAGDRSSFSMGNRFRFMTVAEIVHEQDTIRFVLQRN
jgi:hypothetical protein